MHLGKSGGGSIHQPEKLLLSAPAPGPPEGGDRLRGGRPHPSFPSPSVYLFLSSFLFLPFFAPHPLAAPLLSAISLGPQRHFPLRCLQISSFANSSWSRTDGLAWLGELQAYTWRNDSDTIRFLKPWSQGRFSDQQWENLQHIFLVYRISFTRDIQEFVTMLHVDYPFDIQISGGCEVLLGNTSKSFLDIAFQGKAVVSFQGTFWVPDPDSPPWVQKACKVANQDRGTRETVQWLLDSICPGLVRGLLETGKSELEKPVQPEAWLSSGPAPGPGRLLLGCHVSGFYPNPVWAMWMRGEQEQPGTRRGDVLPQADGTWYLRVTLDVAAGEAAGLSCRVRHSSLGDQDIILYWGRGQASPGLIAGLVVAFLLILTCVGLAFCCQRRRRYHGIM